MKIIIAGGRDFNNYEYFCKSMEGLEVLISEIVCGGASGADSLGEKWAKEHDIPIKYFLADWETYGKAAGAIRNKQMGDYADYLVAFWDKKSRGTKNMIDYMKSIKKKGRVFIYE